VPVFVMSDLVAQTSSSPAGVSPQSIEVAAPAEHHFSFHELLSELNPLQYVPVVGTIYRAVTGDTIPESAREVGSLVFSGLTGGPIGIATNVATLALERATGIDLEDVGRDVLASLGIGGHDAGAVAVAAAQPAASPAAPATPSPAPAAWSPSQLMAYGVTMAANGTLTRGALNGADVLNDMELARHSAQRAAFTYAADPVLPNS
jgi:hypothetical protein